MVFCCFSCFIVHKTNWNIYTHGEKQDLTHSECKSVCQGIVSTFWDYSLLSRLKIFCFCQINQNIKDEISPCFPFKPGHVISTPVDERMPMRL